MASMRGQIPVPQAMEEAADALHIARRDGQRIDVVSNRWPQIGLKDARAVARRFTGLGGEDFVGFKLGFTSAAMAIERLDWHRLVHPRVELEVALVTSRPIMRLTDVTPLAIASVHAAIEIVDTRFTEYRFTFIDNTADNSSAAGFILVPASPVSILESGLLKVVFDNGEGGTISGSSDYVLGGPLRALEWLADARAKDGLTIPAGTIILIGRFTRAPYLLRGASTTADFGQLGELSVSRC